MESYLLESRRFVIKTTNKTFFINKYANQPERFMLLEDYKTIFPNDEILDDIMSNEKLVDILKIQESFKIQMLLLIQINVSLFFIHTSELISLRLIFEKINVFELAKKYTLTKLLFYLYELYTSPGIVEFLKINNFNNLELKHVMENKHPTFTLQNYWENIFVSLFEACEIENFFITFENQLPKEIPYWTYRLIILEDYLPLQGLNNFILINFKKIQKCKTYENFRTLKVSNAFGNVSTLERLVLKETRQSSSSSSIIQPLQQITIKKTLKRNTTTTKSPSIKKKKNSPPPQPVRITCPLCLTNQPCFACNTPCSACHYMEGGEHLCKDDRNTLNKEVHRDAIRQELSLKNGQKLKGYRLNNMVFEVKGHLFDTTKLYCHCPSVPELHQLTAPEPVWSVSLRLYVYDNKQYRLGTLKHHNMRVIEGDDVYADFKIYTDASMVPIQPPIKQIIAIKNDKSTIFSFEEKKLLINEIESNYKKSSIRVYRVWNSISGKFHEELPPKTEYCISYGILDNVEKKIFDSVSII